MANLDVKALLTSRNGIAEKINARNTEILGKKEAFDALGEKADENIVKEKLTELNGMLEEQKTARKELDEIDSLIDNVMEIEERKETLKSAGMTEEEAERAVTKSSTAQFAESARVTSDKKGNSLGYRIGEQFYHFLQKSKNSNFQAIKSRPAVKLEADQTGQAFHSLVNFTAVFGKDQMSRQDTLKHAENFEGIDFGVVQKGYEDYQTELKSMFTQHPLAGGDGSQYNPTGVFSGNTGGLCEFEIDNDISVLPYPESEFMSCIPTRNVTKPYSLFVRQTRRINNASAVAESISTPPVNFLVLKPESEFGFTQFKCYTLTFADTQPVSEEFMADCPQVADIVETQLMENVRQVFINQVLNGNGATGAYPQLIGLLAQVGLSTRVHKGAANFGGTAMGAGAATDLPRDTIRRAIFDALAFGYNPSCVVVSHDDYVSMALQKESLAEVGGAQYSLRNLYTDAELNAIMGVRVVRETRLAPGMALVADFARAARILIRQVMRLDIGWVGNQFRQDMLTLRATMRGGLCVKEPAAIIRVSALAS